MDRLEHAQADHVFSTPDDAPVDRNPFVRSHLHDVGIPSPKKKSHRRQEVRDDGDAALFATHRGRLLRIACRMLGSRADAEDLVQDVYLRWHRAAKGQIKSPIAFLVTITCRLCLDRLRDSRRQRECSGPWLLEASVEEQMPSPEMQIEFSEDVSIGLGAVLERLGPEERAAFLLHDVFDYDYREVGRILRRLDSTCRQTIHRARAHLRDSRARFAVTPECHERVLRKFVVAVGTGDRKDVMALLAEHVDQATRPG